MLSDSDLPTEPQIIKKIIDVVDTAIYWKDKKGRYLGCNQYVLKITGLNSLDEIFGKTDFDLCWKKEALKIKEIDDWVMRTGNSYRGEEVVSVNGSNRLAVFFTIKNPLLDKKGHIIGIVGTSVDISTRKDAERLVLENKAYKAIQEQERKFRQIIDVVDVSVYWKDREGRYLGCNQYVLKIAGLNSLDEILGKTDFDLLWKKEAPKLKEIDDLVMSIGSSYSGEEVISIDGGNFLTGFSVKNPLFDDDGQVIGIVGTSIDITAKKEAEALKLEVEKQKIIEEQQRGFRKIVEQVAHDIRSPVGALRMNLMECKHYLPESYRIAFNKSVTRIDDTAYRFLSAMVPTEASTEKHLDKVKELTLISNEILEVMAEKRYEYQERTIDFCEHFTGSAYFAFLNTNALDFKRMLSNLINNAVDAIQNKIGRVDVHVDVRDSHIQVIIEDNGGGMPAYVKEKILNNIAVTAGKAEGHGIGFGQIRDTLKESEGQLAIESQESVGTKIILTFPEAEVPDWVATDIELFMDDTIVILDDDDSIHDAWEMRFQKVAPDIPRHHFRDGKEAVFFINGFDEVKKRKLLLLTDYELLEQELHGLEVVEQTGVKRSILVTSHDSAPKVRTLAKSHNTRILPKPLAAHIPIELKAVQSESSLTSEVKKEALRQVDVVYVDDDEDILEVMTRAIRRQKKIVDTYSSVYKFLENRATYSKDVKILLDNQFHREHARGVEIAQQLHEEGYMHLYLFSGEDFRFSQDTVIPPYLTVILKSDIDRLLEILNE